MTTPTTRTVGHAKRVLGMLPLLVGLFALATTGCGLLDVSDPTRIEDDELNNAVSADLLRRDALTNLAVAVASNTWLAGLFSDEFFHDLAPGPVQSGALSAALVLDRRESERYETYAQSFVSPYSQWQATRRATMAALPKVRANVLEPTRSAFVGQLLAVRGFATLHLAEDFCPGLGLGEIRDGVFVPGPPLSTVQLFERALADFDSAVIAAADSAPILNLARIGQGRALLGLGRFAEAGAAVTAVPADFVWKMEYSTTVSASAGSLQHSLVFVREVTGPRSSVADHEGGNGLGFVSANDPRLRTTPLGLAYDGVTMLSAMAKYPTKTSPITFASATEARLIEAEAAFHTGGNWLGILNALRHAYVPALADTTDPGTDVARVNLLFRERAFWLFATGHRLGDLRRLIAFYARTPEQVFPTGHYRLGGLYYGATSLAFPGDADAINNPAITGCTTR